MAKKKRSSKKTVNNQHNRSEHTAQTKESVTPRSNIPYLIIIASLVLVIAYLLSGGGPNRSADPITPQPLPNSGPSIYDQPVLYTGDISQPDLQPEFSTFFPDNISGMRRVPLQMDPMNDETGQQFFTDVVDKVSLLYLSDYAQTDFEIEYSVYKMESAQAANQVLDFYKSHWNNIPVQYENLTFWVWNGYNEQLQSGNYARSSGVYIYWDTLSDAAFLPMEERYGSQYISSVNQSLYCKHGEAVKDEYFIMADVHAPLESINALSDRFFAEAARQITS